MLITVSDLIARLQEECAATSGPEGVRLPEMFASMQVFVFDESWVDDEFNPFWWEYLATYRSERNQPLENNEQRGICDEISERCGSHFSEATRKLMGDVDCRSGAPFVRIRIPADAAINRVPGPGGHEPILLVTTKDGKTFTLWIYEPQNRLRTPLAAAVAAGISVRDIWL